MPDYGEILRFLAKNPPQLESEKQLHASLLELLATCLRCNTEIAGPPPATQVELLEAEIVRSHIDWVHFS